MRINLKTSVFLLLLLPSISNAEIKLSTGEGVSILAINGTETTSKSFFKESNTVSLPDGTNQVVAQYTAEIPFSGDDFSLEQSKVFVITFKSEADNLTLKSPRIKSMRNLENFNNEKNWSLTNQSNKQINYKADILEKEGFQLVRDYESELKAFNKSNSPAALIITALITTEASNSNHSTNNRITKENNNHEKNRAADMLRFWYDQADPDTRADFIRWITNK